METEQTSGPPRGGPIEPPPLLVEACVDSVESAMAAESAGAGRVELCDNLVEGGTTPSAGMIAACRERVGVPVFVMIRPRGGDFLYSDVELDVMRRDVALARELGAHGLVFGLLRRDGSIDVERTRVLVEAARPCAVTFHRAFDQCRDPLEALEALVGLGVERVLTSGQAPSVPEGSETIAALVRQARGRIGILPGGGINERNARGVVDATGVRELHVRSTSLRPSPMEHHNPRVDFGGRTAPSDRVREATDPDRIRQLLHSLRAG